jgi:protein SCO1/2
MKCRLWFPALAIATLIPSGWSAASLPSPPAAQVGVEENLGAQVPLNLTLNDEMGHPVTLGALIDKPTILTLNFFRCTGICTPLLNGIAAVVGQTRLRPGQDFQVITVSFDPSDTPEIAQQKQTNYLNEIHRPIAPAAWRFLTGRAEATRMLCDSVGFKFQAQGDSFIHPGVVVVLSAKGRVTSYLYGVSFLTADFERAAMGATQGGVPPTGSYLFQYFQGEDPQGAPYRIITLKFIASLSILLSLAALGIAALWKKRASTRTLL